MYDRDIEFVYYVFWLGVISIPVYLCVGVCGLCYCVRSYKIVKRE